MMVTSVTASLCRYVCLYVWDGGEGSIGEFCENTVLIHCTFFLWYVIYSPALSPVTVNPFPWRPHPHNIFVCVFLAKIVLSDFCIFPSYCLDPLSPCAFSIHLRKESSPKNHLSVPSHMFPLLLSHWRSKRAGVFGMIIWDGICIHANNWE